MDQGWIDGSSQTMMARMSRSLASIMEWYRSTSGCLELFCGLLLCLLAFVLEDYFLSSHTNNEGCCISLTKTGGEQPHFRPCKFSDQRGLCRVINDLLFCWASLQRKVNRRYLLSPRSHPSVSCRPTLLRGYALSQLVSAIRGFANSADSFGKKLAEKREGLIYFRKSR
jgi:hypothetical protein